MTGTPGGPGAPTVIGVDAGSADLRGADHLARDLVARLGLPDTTVACTHPVRSGERPHIAVSLALPDADTAASVWHRLVTLLTEADEGRHPQERPSARCGTVRSRTRRAPRWRPPSSTAARGDAPSSTPVPGVSSARSR